MSMRVIGIDPGLVRPGWGVVEAHGDRLVHLGDGFCRSGKGDLAERLARLYDELQTVLETHAPQAAAVEQTFVSKDAAGTLKLGHCWFLHAQACPSRNMRPTPLRKRWLVSDMRTRPRCST